MIILQADLEPKITIGENYTFITTKENQVVFIDERMVDKILQMRIARFEGVPLPFTMNELWQKSFDQRFANNPNKHKDRAPWVKKEPIA